MKQLHFLKNRSCFFFILIFLFIFALPVSGAKRDTRSDKKSRAFARSVGIQSTRAWKVYVAAEEGDVESQYSLAVKYNKGDGVKQSRRRAAEWYRKAAEQGHLEAQYKLAYMYSEERGVEQNLPVAFKWYGKAAGQGHLEAQRILESHKEFAKYKIQLDSILSRHINSLKVSDHNKQVFQSKEIYFIGDLIGRTETELLKILNFSMPNLTNVKATLAPLYLELGMDVWFLYFEHKKKEWNPVLAHPIENLELSTRTKNALKDEGDTLCR